MIIFVDQLHKMVGKTKYWKIRDYKFGWIKRLINLFLSQHTQWTIINELIVYEVFLIINRMNVLIRVY